MKKFIRYSNLILAVLFVSMFIVACGGHGDKKPDNPTSTSITLSISTMNITNSGGSQTITVTSNANWSAKGTNGVTVSPASGKSGSTSVKITVPANSGSSSKTYTVTFTAGKSSQTLTITQSDQGGASDISVSPESINIDAAATSVKFDVKCAGEWSIVTTNLPEWISGLDKNSGSGNATVTVNTNANTQKSSKTYVLSLKSGTKSTSVVLIKAAAANNAPTKPTNLKPQGAGAETMPEFSWTASTDADNEEITYTIMYSTNSTDWTSLPSLKETSKLSPNVLEKNTTYYYKVVASDGYEGGRTESDVVSFTTGETKSYYADCEWVEYMTATVARPVVLIYTGDGYTQDLYKYGGQFDTEVDRGIEALFDIEPYRTYRHYFTVYKIAAYSNEAGMSRGSTDWKDATKKVDTRFHCSWEGGNSTGIGCERERVIQVVENVPGMRGATQSATLNNLTWSPTSIIINDNVYAGTNIFWAGFGGFGVLSVAQTPARHPAGSGYGGFANTLRHEFGGHGFGLLADEYVYYNSQTIPDEDKRNRQAWKNYGLIGCYGNVTFNNDAETCEWAQFLALEGANAAKYAPANIGLYAGGLMYGLGVWRPEATSCMIDNRPHFNTQSRWQIYRRIKITAGEQPDLDEFIQNDVEVVQAFAPATKSSTPSKLPHPPIMYGPDGRRVQ